MADHKISKSTNARSDVDEPRLVRCPQCSGFGKLATFGQQGKLEIPCDMCKGGGKVATVTLQWVAQGRAMKDYRINELKLTLRKAAKRFKYDVSNLSKMERGIIKPVPVYGPLPPNAELSHNTEHE